MEPYVLASLVKKMKGPLLVLTFTLPDKFNMSYNFFLDLTESPQILPSSNICVLVGVFSRLFNLFNSSHTICLSSFQPYKEMNCFHDVLKLLVALRRSLEAWFFRHNHCIWIFLLLCMNFSLKLRTIFITLVCWKFIKILLHPEKKVWYKQ